MVRHRPREGERVALFGGAFNPPHLGHVAICAWLISQSIADRVWAIPCFEHPFGKELAPFDDRFRMCLYAFQHFGGQVEVSDVERRLGEVSYTVRTVEYFKERYPKTEFSLVVGGDIEQEKKKWRDYDRLVKMLPFVTIPRGEKSHIPDISATEVRSRVRAGGSIERLVSPAVAVYIVAKGLYRSSKVTVGAE